MKLYGSLTQLTSVQLQGSSSGNTVTVQAHASAATATFTLPNASSDTVATLAATQTLQNKTLDNTNAATLKTSGWTLQDAADATKQVSWSLSGITTGNTRTITMPDASITLVGTATAQTLTNKTLTSPTITGMSATATSAFALRDTSAAFDVTVAATSSSTLTAGRTLTLDMQNASYTLKAAPLSNFSTLADGSSGQLLQTNGTGTGYTWVSSASTLPLTTLGDIVYENATPAPARLAGNTTTTKKFLTQTGTGSVSAAPGWNTIVSSDLPAASSSASGSVSYEDHGSFTANFTGPFSTSQAVTINYARVGNQVILRFPQFTAAAAVGATTVATSGSTDIPSALRPPAQVQVAGAQAVSAGAGVTSPLQCVIDSGGLIRIFRDFAGGNFGTTSTNGWNGFAAAYTVN